MRRLSVLLSHLSHNPSSLKSQGVPLHGEVNVPNLPESFVSKIQKFLPESRFTLRKQDRDLRGKDRSFHAMQSPQAVCLPQNEDEVVQIVNLCREYKIPIIPYGRGTSLEGHIAASRGGVTIDFKNMNKIVALHKEDMDVIVEPGISYEDLNKELKKHNLLFAVDPGPGATIGGMVATSCSGPNAVKYGTMKVNVISLRVVLASGQVIKTANRARKSSAGYNLTQLFVGSEGTLGIVTQVTLRLHRKPEVYSAAVCSFENEKAASECVIGIMQAGGNIGRVELLDALMMKAINLRSKFNYPEKTTLIFEFSGSKGDVEEQTEKARIFSEKFGGSHFKWATDEKEREALWQARKVALWSSRVLRPGSQTLITDVAVPISRLAECIEETRKDLSTSFLPAPIVGHAGDGNFHLFILFDPDKPEELKEALRINKLLVERAIRMEGTCTGEHGVGVGKKEYLYSELGKGTVETMKNIKKTFDPFNLLNPDKVV